MRWVIAAAIGMLLCAWGCDKPPASKADAGPGDAQQADSGASADRAAGSEWAQLPDLPLSYASCCNALEYFPELQRVVFTRGSSDGDTEIFSFDPGASSWVQHAAQDDMPMGDFHDFAEYSPTAGALLFGGGQVYQVGLRSELSKMDAAGTVTPLADAPLPFDVASAITVAEPATGNLLLIHESAPTTMHEYVVSSDAWQTREITSAFSVNNSYDDLSTVAVAIPEYGVVMFLKGADSGSGVWLYKHAPQ